MFCCLLSVSFAIMADDADTLFSKPDYAPLLVGTADQGAAALAPGRVALTPGESDALILPAPGHAVELPSIDRFTGNEATPLRFRPVLLFARGSTITLLSEAGATSLPRPGRQYYLAGNATTGVGLAVDPLSGQVSGFATRGGDRLEISGDLLGGLEFAAVEEPDPADNSCANGDVDLGRGTPPTVADSMVPSASAAAAGDTITYQAVVAIDTDTEWMAGLGNDTVAATQWIADLFLAMNVFYERDVETQLLIGDVILRTGSDPYSVPSDRYAQLNEFGKYWKDNMQGVERQFAALLSGRSVCSGCFSGIAWLDAYCEYGSSWGSATPGSFSYNAIGSGRTAANTALYVGHELGHNMGSPHTHCYSPPVDTCYNGEGGCYSGSVSCPTGGKGTIMSYCHVGGGNGAGCGTSKSEFHPRVQSLIEGRLASQLVAGCILPYQEEQPQPVFSANPGAGSSLDFGEDTLGETGALHSIQVNNDGNSDLTISCALSGNDASSFLLQSCPSLLAPAVGGTIGLRCSPNAIGSLAATLTVTTNDPAQATALYALGCTGVPVPIPDMIFNQSFEE